MKKIKKDKKKFLKIAIILCIGLILCLLFLLTYLSKNNKNEQIETVTIEEKQEAVTNYVRNKGEKERMQIYLSEYIQLIEQKEYDLAYELLYPEFKENFFQTKEDYISYVQENYSDLMMLDYNSIERQGDYYILTVTITNLDDIGAKKTQKFVIFENGLNDYYLSFQAE